MPWTRERARTVEPEGELSCQHVMADLADFVKSFGIPALNLPSNSLNFLSRNSFDHLNAPRRLRRLAVTVRAIRKSSSRRAIASSLAAGRESQRPITFASRCTGAATCGSVPIYIASRPICIEDPQIFANRACDNARELPPWRFSRTRNNVGRCRASSVGPSSSDPCAFQGIAHQHGCTGRVRDLLLMRFSLCPFSSHPHSHALTNAESTVLTVSRRSARRCYSIPRSSRGAWKSCRSAWQRLALHLC